MNYHAERRVDGRQISPKDGLMLRMLDLISLARLRAVRYELKAINNLKLNLLS